MKKVAFITAIYGGYESTCKPFIPQSISSDFICFTDNPNIESNGWKIDITPYHDTQISPIDDGLHVNSLHKNNIPNRLPTRFITSLSEFSNRHSFNITKYYKQQWHLIPRLKEYDVIIWLDGTIEIIDITVAEYMLKLCSKYQIVSWNHELRGGMLFHEAYSSFLPKYHDQNFLGQKQPYQNIISQYMDYIREGYDESFWDNYPREEGRGKGNHFGVWVTCFVAFNNQFPQIKQFLDLWYLQTLKYTTQDQVGFPKVIQDTKIIPYTLPDQIFSGDYPHEKTSIYIKHEHFLK